VLIKFFNLIAFVYFRYLCWWNR